VPVCFTHFDPFEDTERHDTTGSRERTICFTHFDPFEDTERAKAEYSGVSGIKVSPTSIRSRILKAVHKLWLFCHPQVSPTSIRSRILKVLEGKIEIPDVFSFTHFDPFEDTESLLNLLL